MLARAITARLEATCLAGIAGLVVGLLGAIAWRYTATRYLVDVSPRNVAAGDKGYIFTFDYLEYVSGPSWWPTTGALPAAGLAVGLVLGLTYSYVSQQVTTVSARTTAHACTAAVMGISIGAGTYFYGRFNHPVVKFRAITDPTYRGPSLSSDSRIVPGAPWFAELSPAWLYLPLGGALTAVLITTLLAVVRGGLRREAAKKARDPESN